MKLLLELTQENGSTLQVLSVQRGAYVSEALRDSPDGEVVDGQGVQLDAASIDAVIAALQTAKRELAMRLETAAE